MGEKSVGVKIDLARAIRHGRLPMEDSQVNRLPMQLLQSRAGIAMALRQYAFLLSAMITVNSWTACVLISRYIPQH